MMLDCLLCVFISYFIGGGRRRFELLMSPYLRWMFKLLGLFSCDVSEKL